MKVAVFNAQPHDRDSLDAANRGSNHELLYLETTLCTKTAPLVADSEAICAFVNDRLDRKVLVQLAKRGIRLIALRCAGFNNVDLEAAEELGMTVLRVPAYSPHAVAEHTVALMLALNRKLHRAAARVREQNFSLEGLLGFDLHRKIVGIIGTGMIGSVVARIMAGFGCQLLGHDIVENAGCRDLGMRYVALDELARSSDIITLHCPLTPQTHHLVNAGFLELVKPGVLLINTNRGGVIDTRAVIDSLKSGRIGSLGLDVYEEEADLFFRDLSGQIIQDDIFARLLTFPNVMITAHQAFFTREALANIAETTIGNLSDFQSGTINEENRVTARQFQR